MELLGFNVFELMEKSSKGECHKIFDHLFCARKILPRPDMNTLNRQTLKVAYPANFFVFAKIFDREVFFIPDTEVFFIPDST